MRGDISRSQARFAARIGSGVQLMILVGTASFAQAQSITGRVTEQQSGVPVPGAVIVLFDQVGRPRMTAFADPAGRYLIVAPTPGTYRLVVGGRGLAQTSTEMLNLRAGTEVNMDVRLLLEATTLASVVVTGEKIVDGSKANPTKYDEFLMRRKLGIGTFLTRSDLEARPRANTQSIFATIPGLKVRQHGTEWFIQSQRCPAKLGGSRGALSMDEDNPSWPILFIDGFRVKGLATLSTINPSQIEAIEVYQGAAQLPVVAKGHACAAIFVWLKSGTN